MAVNGLIIFFYPQKYKVEAVACRQVEEILEEGRRKIVLLVEEVQEVDRIIYTIQLAEVTTVNVLNLVDRYQRFYLFYLSINRDK